MLGGRFGVVVNARGFWPDGDELRALGAGWVRSIVYDFNELEQALWSHPPEVRVVALLNQETEGVGSDLSNWPRAVAQFAQRFAGRVQAVECLNEWDLAGIPPQIAVAAAVAAAPELQAAGMTCLLGSVAGPDWPAALQQAAVALSQSYPGLVTGACLHPYGQRALSFPPGWGFGEIDDAVQQAYAQLGLPIWVTEFGIPIGDAGGEDGQAQYLQNAYQALGNLPESMLAVACYFCWTDEIGAPSERGDRAFGLRREDRSARAAWTLCASVAQDGIPKRPVPKRPTPKRPTPKRPRPKQPVRTRATQPQSSVEPHPPGSGLPPD